jgi:hypothetical protein
MTQQTAAQSTLSPNWAAFWTALLYLLFVLGVVGGAGIWLPWAMPTKHVGIDALTTFVMAVLAPIIIDLLLDFEVYGRKLSKLWRISIAGPCIGTAALAIVGLVGESAAYGWPAAVFAVLLSLILWLIVALKCERFLPVGSNKGSLGGADPNPDLLGGGGLPQ